MHFKSVFKKETEQLREDYFIPSSTSAAVHFCGSFIRLQAFTSSAAGVGTLSSHAHTDRTCHFGSILISSETNTV